MSPDPEGNSYGLYGCVSHQHPISRKNQSEIVFRNKADANEFFEKNLRSTYRSQTSHFQSKNKRNRPDYRRFECRRRYLVGDKKVDCKSVFSFKESMPRVEDLLPKEDRPYCLVGVFYHCHENDENFHRNELGGYVQSRKNKPKKKKPYYARVINNQIFPIRARLQYTVKEVMEAKEKGHSLVVADINTIK